jgi:phage tail protein X|tara:strand:+ start:231 stop:533 length:303 start_codon:yes stop_codon:yes gene_type:complete
MSRYESSKILKSKDNNRIYKSNIFPKIERSVSDIYIITRSGDRLDLLASKYYGDQTLWWIIAIANNLGRSGLIVPPAKQIRIPTDVASILNDYQELQEDR